MPVAARRNSLQSARVFPASSCLLPLSHNATVTCYTTRSDSVQDLDPRVDASNILPSMPFWSHLCLYLDRFFVNTSLFNFKMRHQSSEGSIAHFEVVKKLGCTFDVSLYRMRDEHDRLVLAKICMLSGKLTESATPRFENEWFAAKRLSTLSVMPALKHSGESRKMQWLVFEPAQESLEDVMKSLKRPLFLHTVLKIALKAVKMLEKIHDAGVIHGNITPRKLRIARDGKDPQLQVIDFYHAKAVERETRVRKGNAGSNASVNWVFSSVHSQSGGEPRRKDDVIALIYSLVYAAKSGVNWMYEKDREKVKEMKMVMGKEGAFSGMPDAFEKCFRDVTKLKAGERPDYGKMRERLRKEFDKFGWRERDAWQW